MEIYRIETYSSDGLILEKFIDMASGEPAKYSGGIPVLTQNGPELIGAEFDGTASLPEVFKEYKQVLTDAQEKLRSEIKKLQADAQKPKLIVG